MQAHLAMLLPITSASATLRLQREHEIGDAVQVDPNRLRPRKAVALAVEETNRTRRPVAVVTRAEPVSTALTL